MWKDIIVEEARKPGEQLAKRFNYDIHKIFEFLRKQEEKHNKNIFISHPLSKN